MAGFLQWLFRRRHETSIVVAENAEARAYIARLHIESTPHIRRRTVALYGVNRCGCPYILGSGVPLQVADARFVVTAAHVLDGVLTSKHGIYLSPGMQGGRLVDLDGSPVHRTAIPRGGTRRDDQCDLCLMRLTDSVASQLGPEIEFVRPGEVSPNDNQSPGSYYFLNGFPKKNLKVSLRKRTVRCESLPYGSILYIGDRGNWPSATDDIHLDLDFDPKKSVDDQGNSVHMPGPVGISGCGIWRLHQAGERVSDWSVDKIRLVAIEHRWNSELHILRGTRIAYANQIMGNNYPDLCEQMYSE